MKRDYIKEYYQLQREVDNEMFKLYTSLGKKFGTHPLAMGREQDGSPVVHQSWIAIDVQFEMKLGGWFTKVNHLVHDTRRGFNNVIIKGFRLGCRKYQMKTFSDLDIEKKIEIIELIKEKYNE
jgi:hypothetical protein